MDKSVITIATDNGESIEEFPWTDESAPTADDLDIDSWGPDAPAETKALGATGILKFRVVKISAVPQFKTQMTNKVIGKVFGKKIIVKVPVVYRRFATKTLYAAVTYPKSMEAQAVKHVESCGKVAAVAAVAGLAKGGVAGALIAFNSALQSCILTKLGENATQLKGVPLVESQHTDWVPY